MRILFSIFAIFIVSTAIFAQSDSAAGDLQKFREIREKEFRNPQTSPLSAEYFANFKGLKFFPFDKNLRIAGKFVKTPDEKIFLMPTSAGTSRRYYKIGIIKFRFGTGDYVLSAYQSEQSVKTPPKSGETKTLFIPFKDLSNKTETYAAGRYLYLAMPAGEDVILDFNYAVNPFCAYGNPQFSCALPPKENFLETEIKAGEKIYSSKAEVLGKQQ